MTKFPPVRHIYANGANVPPKTTVPLVLDCRQKPKDGTKIKTRFPNFVTSLYHLNDRVLDLLEIACYVFSADRLISRGADRSVEYHSWSRKLCFHIKVRDYLFWSQEEVRQALSQSLLFMMGDAEIEFNFEEGHSTPKIGIFDSCEFSVSKEEISDVNISLFSGGLDSLSGAIDMLEKTDNKIVLVSHISSPSIIKTQRALIDSLIREYPQRVHHYQFECTLSVNRPPEESQRSRSFLYASIAFAIADAYKKSTIYVYENGITSINLRRREDLMNARSSRTTHPKTMNNLERLFSIISEAPFKIELPYMWLTKTDVMNRFKDNHKQDIISSSVSCSKTFKINGTNSSHCGWCFQCIDRRLAAYASDTNDKDHIGLYSFDFITEKIEDGATRTTLIDYIRQAVKMCNSSVDSFQDEFLSDLSEVIDFIEIEGATYESEKVEALCKLFKRHGEQVDEALFRIVKNHRALTIQVEKNSLLDIIKKEQYLRQEVELFVDSLIQIISQAIPEMFAKHKPKDEPDLNEKLGSLLRSHNSDIQSEHPTLSFACSNVTPDHTSHQNDVLIEAKYIRGNTSPSKATEGIAADLTKYKEDSFILFVVYDPTRRIPSDEIFKQDIEAKGRNRVLIVR